jgi:hypothetical protein
MTRMRAVFTFLFAAASSVLKLLLRLAKLISAPGGGPRFTSA